MTTSARIRRRLLTVSGLMLALGLTTALARNPAPTAPPLSLWRISGNAGHVMYLAGSMHALTKADMPLPEAFTQAFDDSNRLIEELNLPRIDQTMVAQEALRLGTLKGTTLEQTLGKTAWLKAQKLAAQAGLELVAYNQYKPWLATILIGDALILRLGYEPQLSPDMHFARLAKKRNMPSSGLETVTQQLSYFNDMSPAVQKRFLMQTLTQTPGVKAELIRLHAAWAHGDISYLDAQLKKEFKGFERLRKRLLDDRNIRWLPRLEKCLASGTTCFVVVGVDHMVGPQGLLALLREHGYKVTQMHSRTIHAGGG